MGKLDGKVALVTGAGRGIGQAIALKLASEGARIVLNDLDDGPAEDTIARITGGGGEAVAVIGDVTAEAFAGKFIGTAMETFGGLDIIVNRVHPEVPDCGLVRVHSALRDGRQLLSWLGTRERRGIEELKSLLGDSHPLVEIPLLPKEPTDLVSLGELSELYEEQLAEVL